MKQLLGNDEVLFWDITNTYMKSYVLCFSLLYRLLNLLLNVSNFFSPGKNQGLHQDRVVWKTWLISRSGRFTLFFFLEKNKICIKLKLFRILDENCSSTMFLCYIFQCKTAVDEYADILFELIANELVNYYSVLQILEHTKCTCTIWYLNSVFARKKLNI